MNEELKKYLQSFGFIKDYCGCENIYDYCVKKIEYFRSECLDFDAGLFTCIITSYYDSEYNETKIEAKTIDGIIYNEEVKTIKDITKAINEINKTLTRHGK